MANVAGGLVFFSQLTKGDRGAYVGTIGDKAKTLVNNVFGNILGVNPIPNAPVFQQSFSLDNAANKFSGIGLGGLIYSMIPIKALPHKARVRTIARRVLVGGILGGLFTGGSGVQTQSFQTQSFAPRLSTSGSQVTTS